VASKPMFFAPQDLEGLPLQVMALPWVSRSSMMATLEMSGTDPAEVYSELEERLNRLVKIWFEERVTSGVPVILTAHASVTGAQYGGERSVMLGADLVLPGSLVRDPRLSYVALGHIHKPQDLNEGQQPPVIYPGSIERVDFGEVYDDKFFVIAHVEAGVETTVEWRKLPGRRFIDRAVRITTADGLPETILNELPEQEALEDAIVRLVIEYPQQFEPLLNEPALRQYAEKAFEFHLVRRPLREARLRLPGNQAIASLTPLDLLNVYWRSVNTSEDEASSLLDLAKDVIASVSSNGT
jgi:DNA repair protein SbcD/Mre11